ncbi:MAG: DNA-binding transcriptional ArsR family regulator [Myxococcota bacterium]
MLNRAGVLHAEKQGREMYYRLEVGELVSILRGIAGVLEECLEQSQQATV